MEALKGVERFVDFWHGRRVSQPISSNQARELAPGSSNNGMGGA